MLQLYYLVGLEETCPNNASKAFLLIFSIRVIMSAMVTARVGCDYIQFSVIFQVLSSPRTSQIGLRIFGGSAKTFISSALAFFR